MLLKLHKNTLSFGSGIHLEGTFKELMELEDFPFDFQASAVCSGAASVVTC